MGRRSLVSYPLLLGLLALLARCWLCQSVATGNGRSESPYQTSEDPQSREGALAVSDATPSTRFGDPNSIHGNNDDHLNTNNIHIRSSTATTSTNTPLISHDTLGVPSDAPLTFNSASALTLGAPSSHCPMDGQADRLIRARQAARGRTLHSSTISLCFVTVYVT